MISGILCKARLKTSVEWAPVARVMDETTSISRTATLAGFTAAVATTHGVHLQGSRAHDDAARPYPQLAVSHHRVGRRCGARRRRRVLPGLTPAHFSGASVGGSFLKVGWIGIGLRMEILVDGRRIVTSPVRDISTAGSRQQPRPLTASDILRDWTVACSRTCRL